MNVRGISATLCSCFVVAALAWATPARANDIAPFTTVFDTDWSYAGVGALRDIGSGSITLGGVTGTVMQAFLYWHGPTQTTDPTANMGAVFNGTAIVGSNIGFSSDNNWNYLNSQAYRADVTSLVAGNGVYTVSGLLKDSGRINVNGASLVVFFDDGDDTNNRDVVLFDGNDSNIANPYDANNWNVGLAGINYTSGSAAIVMGVSDGQSFADDAVLVNGITLVAAGAVFDGTTVPPFTSPPTNGTLWDIASYDITSYLSPGPNSLDIFSGVNGDALALIHVAIDLPAGAAPETVVPEPGSLALLFGAASGLGGLAFRRRKR